MVINSLGYAAVGIALGGDRALSRALSSAGHEFVSKRPAVGQRKFVSKAVEGKIVQVKHAITDLELAWLFENCLPNTLDTTVTFGTHESRPDTYVITGDINAMWLRDSTAPSLLSLPYFGCCAADDATYLNTRAFVLSEDNPYFFRGRACEGIGGPLVGLNMIWPLGIIMRALTSRDNREILSCLKMLKKTHAGTGFMHESKRTRERGSCTNRLIGMIFRSSPAPGSSGRTRSWASWC